MVSRVSVPIFSFMSLTVNASLSCKLFFSDLVSEYQQYQEASADDEGEFDDDDEEERDFS